MGSTLNMIGGGGGGIKLESIAITTPPNKTQYLAGETFNPAGMVVTATYSNGATLVATGYSYTPDGPLTDGVASVTITYTEGGISKSATQPITVIPALVSIAVTTPPTTTTYEYGDAFSASGMVVTATMSDNSTKTVTEYTTSPATFTALGSQNVTISYSENGITKTTTQPVTVERATITVPTQSGSLTYNGAAQSPSWSGYDSSKMTLGGDTVGTNAGTYNATFTPTAYYRWPDGTTSAKTVQWSIAKAAGYLSISPTSLTLDSSNMTGTISVTRYGNGAISAISNDTGVATVSVSGTTVTVTGHQGGNAIITISVAADNNHNAPANKQCNVTLNLLPIGTQWTYTSAQTFTVPVTGTYQVELHGGGGGGGGGGNYDLSNSGGTVYPGGTGGGGGGSGGQTTVELEASERVSIVIGKGGNGGNGYRWLSTQTAGTAGTASSFGSYFTVAGGGGGGEGGDASPHSSGGTGAQGTPQGNLASNAQGNKNNTAQSYGDGGAGGAGAGLNDPADSGADGNDGGCIITFLGTE